ncbi:MAG: 2,3-bisphosphoglycerate-independent phosphoglycerate mutase [Patescibacteria group bacterium]
MAQQHKPTVLIVLDGWGVAVPSQANAIAQAKTPAYESAIQNYPTLTLQASGEATGLPWSEVGNSEVGHMSIGAGRIIFQELSRINNAISQGSFFSNSVFLQALEHCKKSGGTLHLLGLVSSGGVHSHIEHLFALLELCKQQNVQKIALHIILDGRDTPYAQGIQFVNAVAEKCDAVGAQIASLSGRFYALDRDHHWDREEKAYRAIAEGISDHQYESAVDAVEKSYAASVYDEEFVPAVITKDGKPLAPIVAGDAVIFTNIRADRARQMTHAFMDDTFDKFERKRIDNLFFVTMTEYEKDLPVSVAFGPQVVKNCIAEWISTHGLKQIHIAETEKYAHITYFLNDGREEPFLNEKRIMLPSPPVDSYDKKPEMSAREIAKEAVKAIESNEYDFIALNFANSDMVGHTGNLKATIKAVETIDDCLSQIIPEVLARNGSVLITADHGNAETMLDLATGRIDKEHTNNPVPCIIITKELEGKTSGFTDRAIGKDLSALEPSGLLSDVAPTVLSLMGMEKPSEMTGNSLLSN